MKIKLDNLRHKNYLTLFSLLNIVALLPTKCFAGIEGPIYGNCNLSDPTRNWQLSDIICVGNNVLTLLLSVTGAIIIIMIIISGVMYITSAGNPQQAEKAKKTLVGAIIGLIIVSASGFLIQLVVRLMGA